MDQQFVILRFIALKTLIINMGRIMSEVISKKAIIRYIAELTIVVFGITIAFMLNDWADGKREQKNEIEYLENICEELLLNVDLFNDWESYYENITDRFEKFYDLQMVDDSSRAAAIEYRQILVETHSIYVFSDAWETMKSSGGMRIIKNSGLKNNLSAVYSRWYPRTERVFKRLDDFKSHELIPYYNQHRAGRDPSFIDLKNLQAPQLYNIMRTFQIYHSVLRGMIKDSKEKTETVITLIENYINNSK